MTSRVAGKTEFGEIRFTFDHADHDCLCYSNRECASGVCRQPLREHQPAKQLRVVSQVESPDHNQGTYTF